MDVVALRAALSMWQFWALEAQFVLFVAFSVLNLPRVIRRLAPPTSALIVTFAASAFAVALVAGVVPRTNRIYYDEHIYQGIAQNLSDLRRAQMCNEGTVEYGRLQCWRGEYNKQPYGYPYLLSLAYRMFGVRTSIAHVVNLVSAGLFVWAILLTAAMLFGDWRAASLSALIAATIPEHLIWSGTAAAEPWAALMVLLAILSATWFAREQTTIALGWMVATTAFAIQFKIESGLIVGVVALIVALCAPVVLRSRSLWAGVAAGALLCSVHVAHLVAVRGEPWGASGDRMSLDFVWPNLLTNAAYYVSNVRFPLIVVLLALAGAVSRPTRAVGVVLASFLLFWGVYLGFYAGSYDYGADVRYALMSHAPVVLLAGRGASWVAGWLPPHVPATATIAAALGFQFLWFMPRVRAAGEEAWAARADVTFAESVAPRLGSNAMVLTHNPSIFRLQGVNAAQLSLAVTDAPYVASALPARYAGGVFLHWSFWCNVDDAQQRAVCTDALGRFRHRIVHERRDRDQRFVFFRLEPGGPAYDNLPLRLLSREP